LITGRYALPRPQVLAEHTQLRWSRKPPVVLPGFEGDLLTLADEADVV
jgi:hypothetical protein